MVIQDIFSIYKQRYIKYDVQLNDLHLIYTPVSLNSSKFKYEEKNIAIKDIIGCILHRSQRTEYQKWVYLSIFYYSLTKCQKRRSRYVITFEISSKDTFQENLDVSMNWRQLIYRMIYSSQDSNSPSLFRIKKHITVFINPRSGPGTALSIFRKRVKPMLDEAELPYEVIITDYPNHAYDLVQKRGFEMSAGLVVVSGDGLIYELFNGLFQRSDWESAIKIPIGVIPGGSGNGMASSIAHTISEPYLSNPVLISTLNIVNPRQAPLDLVIVNTSSGNKLVSFLSIGFGLLADIDIESERLRLIGEARFTIYGLARTVSLRKYRLKLSYKKAHPTHSGCAISKKSNILRSQTQEEIKVSDPPFRTNRSKSLSDDLENKDSAIIHSTSPDAAGTPPNSDLVPISDTPLSLPESNGVQADSAAVECDMDKITQHSDTTVMDEKKEFTLPDDWVTIEDDFVSVYAVNQPFISSDGFFSPKSTLNDGVFWLCYVKGSASKASVLKFLLSIENGSHIDMPDVVYVPVTELQMTPLCPNGTMTIDGERIPLQTIRATIFPSLGNYMVRKNI